MKFSGSFSCIIFFSPCNVCVKFKNVPVILPTTSNPPPITLLINEYTPFAIPSPKPTGPFKKPFLGSLKNSKNPVPTLSLSCIMFLY